MPDQGPRFWVKEVGGFGVLFGRRAIRVKLKEVLVCTFLHNARRTASSFSAAVSNVCAYAAACCIGCYTYTYDKS